MFEMTDRSGDCSIQHPRFSMAETTINQTVPSSLEVLGQGMKELINGARKLRNLGIENLGLPLPKIVVVGDQSTGKSSLIEGISEIKVPRNAGTCTRCPLEINLAESGEAWKCRVSLVKKYTYQGQAQGTLSEFFSGKVISEGPTLGRPLGPWVAQDAEDFFFALLTSQDQVAPTLKRAQLATLSPSSPYGKYMNGRLDPGTAIQVKFSPNIVRLDISGPGLPNMSLYDLPGVISVHEVAEEQYLVGLVKNLVMEYVQDKRCINLLTLPMTDDPVNSSAFDLIRRAAAEGRTVGVFTKPDRVQQGESLEQWTQMLSDQSFRLGLGYYVTRNNPDPYVDHAIARAEERVFFSRPPWSTSLSQYSNRFGTVQLQTFLSRELAQKIGASLPHLKQQVARKAAANTKELETLPDPPSGNVSMILLEAVLDLEAQIKFQVDGGVEPEYSFLKKWRGMAAKFRGVLADSKPEVNMHSTPDSFGTALPLGHKHQVISVDSDSEDLLLIETPTSTSPSKKRLRTPSFDNSPQKRNIPVVQMETPTKSRITNGSVPDRPFAARLTLQQVRDIIQEGHIGLPNEIDPSVTQRVVKLCLEVWEKPLEKFLNGTEKLCQDTITETINRFLGRWRSTALYPQMVSICDAFLKEAMASQRQAAARVLQLELNVPLGLNSEVMVQASQKARLEIQTERRAFLAEQCAENTPLTPSKSGRGNNGHHHAGGSNGPLQKIIDEHLRSDPYGREIVFMGDIRGYYSYALTRFVDTICQGIKGELFLKLRNEIGPLLKQSIGFMEPDAAERCRSLLQVAADKLERRAQLLKERAVIREAQDWLQTVSAGDW